MNVAANPSNKLQDLSRLVPGSVINLGDWELENDDDNDNDDAGSAAGPVLAALEQLLAVMVGLSPD
jgi:hypothetical protein